ncbi:sigma-70 family RNA polymerase sigma factor [Loigolactobacillus bifermentans]|uniref:Uncharacterized protein n=1 Tax=Loigolactobacillus bifermentans DSM 20003 TaxID=1423726 RepID=A0A0R1GEQ7_9LACO|nr:sigma-70 family RNA polymerase sigma factor [Loigolactobacillus bifermentans]KRK32581.1 hypothetical protein FC07_GL002007 [Loigolactobacillus bifermentans DSM 20003]QGG60249.1 hypothetical protein LB003_07150 [Loigolactobacillus bifermentans]
MKQQAPIVQDAFQCLRLYPEIVHGALKKCQITKANQDYHDFKSEAQLSFIAAYCTCMQRPLQAQFVNFNNALGYISRAVVWDLQHLLRKERRQDFYHGAPFILGMIKPAPNYVEHVHEATVYQEICNRCSDEELAFLRLRMAGCSAAQIADSMGSSVRQVYRIHRRLRKWIGPKLLD